MSQLRHAGFTFDVYMHRYFFKTPWIIKKLFPSYVWDIKTFQPEVFLTFDDGPHPQITPWVLKQLRRYNAKATFFCIGNNVQKYPDVYAQIIAEGHAVGNHTFHHLNGWKTRTEIYTNDIKTAAKWIDSALFRPPYGKITRAQARNISLAMQKENAKVIMWDVLSADFDKKYSPEHCLINVLTNYRAGSIIVFHDSEKAFRNLEYVLPRVLENFKEKKVSSLKISLEAAFKS